MPGDFLCCLAHQAHIGAPLAGVLLYRLAHQALKGAPWVGSYSVVQCARCLLGQPLYCSAANAGTVGREAMVMAPSPNVTQQNRLASMAAWLSSTGIFHHNLLPHIPSIYLSAVNSNRHPGCSTIPNLQLPTAVLSKGPASLSGLCMAEARTV